MSFDDLIDDLDDAIEAAGADTEWALQGELRRAEPDFGDVIRRARELDPQAVSEAQAEAAGRVPVASHVPARDRAENRMTTDSLRMNIAAVQAEVESDVEDRRLRAIPALHLPDRPAPGASRWIAGTVAAAAAALGLAWGIPHAIEATGGATNQSASQAALDRADVDESNQAKRPRPVPSPRTLAPAPSTEPMTARVHAPEVEDARDGGEASKTREPKRRGAPRSAEEARTGDAGGDADARAVDPLAELDARAQQLWRSGDLEGAEGLFRQILAKAPGSRHAELAYGDLFTLVRQRGKHTNLETLWHDYLAAFPQGRFADDARAELCARETDPQCWSAYLKDFPRGAHVERAERALGAGQAEP